LHKSSAALAALVLCALASPAYAAPRPAPAPDTTITSVKDNDSPVGVFIDEDGGGDEGVVVTYTTTNATGAQFSFDSGAWQSLGATPASVPFPVGTHTLNVRATAKGGVVDPTPATVSITMCPQAGCATASPTPTPTPTTASPTPTPTPTPTTASPTPTPTTASPTPTPTSTQSAAPQPSGPTGTWNLAFQDEFSGTSLDTTKWNPQDGRTNNNVISEADDITVSGGNAHVFLSQSGTQVYGGFAETRTFNVMPGTAVEARVYMPGACAAGATSCSEDIYDWPGLVWTSARVDWSEDGEYDIAEGLGGSLTINYHSCNDTTPTPGCGDVSNNGSPTPTCCYGNEWHTVTLVRGATSSKIYWDGTLQRTIAVTDSGKAQSIIMNIGKSNSRAVHLGTQGEALVDYVRAWTPA